MDDIICSIPWRCDDHECEAQWHQANYWIYADGEYSVDRYADGDHDPIDEDEVPSYDETTRAWADYAQYVATTGEDPLCQYMVKTTRKVNERWQFRLRQSLAGFVVTQAKRAGKTYVARDLPRHVREYMCMEPEGTGPTLAHLCETDIREDARAHMEECREILDREGLRYDGKWTTPISIENDVPRKANVVRAELMKLARPHAHNPTS